MTAKATETNLCWHLTFEFYWITSINVSITVTLEKCTRCNLGDVYNFIPTASSPGCWFPDFSKTQAFIWFRELPLSCASSAHEVSQYGMSALLRCWQRLMLPPKPSAHATPRKKKKKKRGKKTCMDLIAKGGKNLNVGKWTLNCGCFCLKSKFREERGRSFATEIYWNVARDRGVGLCLSESSFEAPCDATSELLQSRWHIASQMIKPPSTNLQILCDPHILFSNPCDKTFNSGMKGCCCFLFLVTSIFKQFLLRPCVFILNL